MDVKTIDKRLNKLIRKTSLKGVFKKVDTLEECDIVLLMSKNKPCWDIFVTKIDFQEKITPELFMVNFVFRYLKHTNPRYDNNKLSKRLIDRGYSC